MTWFFWSFLWALFFFGMGLGKPNEAITARVALVVSWLTLIVPAMVGMAGLMNGWYDMVWWAVSGTAILYFIVSVKRTKQTIEIAS